MPPRHDLALAEQDDLRATLDWTLDEDPELGLELAVALAQSWMATSPREGMQRFEALLDVAAAAPPELRARPARPRRLRLAVRRDGASCSGLRA